MIGCIFHNIVQIGNHRGFLIPTADAIPSHQIRRGGISEAEFEANRAKWLPTEADKAYLRSIMQAVYEPGKIANWIAPPRRGINDQPFEYEYVRL